MKLFVFIVVFPTVPNPTSKSSNYARPEHSLSMVVGGGVVVVVDGGGWVCGGTGGV